ncbi:MAG: polysaccharide deacetylase family protein [Flavobacteriaceae bacterium]|nr:polysaccharide deacetylase family protein [Flavobacteriaceae bacterium]
MAYLKKISTLGKFLCPTLLWNLPKTGNTLYLTFDDGPIPEITPWVLALLKEYHAKATFFCIGENIVKHPEVFDQILAEGHNIGNHSFNHLNGWKTPISTYIENVEKAEEIISEKQETRNRNQDNRTENIEEREEKKEKNIKLFRPPYGKITPKQIKILQGQGFKIVMWEVISGDFDLNISPENCLNNVIKNSKPGSIVVFHDSIKASANLKEVLPKVLEYFHQKGFEFKAI